MGTSSQVARELEFDGLHCALDRSNVSGAWAEWLGTHRVHFRCRAAPGDLIKNRITAD